MKSTTKSITEHDVRALIDEATFKLRADLTTKLMHDAEKRVIEADRINKRFDLLDAVARQTGATPAVDSTPIGDYYGLGHRAGFGSGQKLGYTDAIEAVLKLMRSSSAYASNSALAADINKLKP